MSTTEPVEEYQYPTGEVVTTPAENPLAPARADRIALLRQAPATHVLIAINVAVFVWMILHGVSITLPESQQLMHYGANDARAVVQGEWWRLLTAMFVHSGALHLATNMWCLWNLGLLGEPLLGAFGMCSVYLLCGAAGNLLSFGYDVWKLQTNVGVGASGAVFGIAGILIVLLSNKRLSEPRNGRPGVPWVELRSLRRSVIQFAAINLVLGLATMWGGPVRIDNSAHLGGFLCGLALGVPLMPRMTTGRQAYLARQKVVFVLFALVLALFGYYITRFALTG